MPSNNYSLDQFKGKEFFVNKDTPLYKHTTANKPFKIVKKGQSAGNVYSYANDPYGDGVIWFIFYDKYNQPYYMIYSAGNINTKQLNAQGAKSIEQEQKEAADKALLETNKIEYYLRKYGLYVLGTFILAAIIKKKL